MPPQRHIRAGGFVQCRARSVDSTELAAALQIGLDDGRNLLGGLRLAPEGGNGNGQLGEAHARHLDAKLRQGRK